MLRLKTISVLLLAIGMTTANANTIFDDNINLTEDMIIEDLLAETDNVFEDDLIEETASENAMLAIEQ